METASVPLVLISWQAAWCREFQEISWTPEFETYLRVAYEACVFGFQDLMSAERH